MSKLLIAIGLAVIGFGFCGAPGLVAAIPLMYRLLQDED